jgi:ABC-type Mn2+/Zn2+ transport system ATPase subunit
MRPVRITLKNYRSFADEDPAIIDIDSGFTALVGPNNSGKSSLLRFFYEFRPVFATLSAAEALISFTRPGSQMGVGFAVADPEQVFSNFNARDLTVAIELTDVTGAENASRVISGAEISFPRGGTPMLKLLVQGQPVTFQQDALTRDSEGPTQPMREAMSRVSELATVFRVLHKAQYFGTFRNAINVDAQNRYYDVEVGKAFIRTWQLAKTGSAGNRRKISKVISEVRGLFGMSDLEVNANVDDTNMAVSLNSNPYDLSELGTGLTQFLTVLGNAALTSPSLILIDEPELGLHPILQVRFLTLLGAYATDGVIFATHSYGLARSSATRIYLLRQTKGGVSTVRPREATSNLTEFLGEMSYSGWQDLGLSCLLLAEGPSDLTAMGQFLTKHRLSGSVLMLPLGGSTMINGKSEAQLNELKRISPSIFALIDSERSAKGEAMSADRQAFINACAKAGVVAQALERRALENYFSDRAIKAVKGPKYRQLTPYERLADCAPAWGKNEGYKIASEMTLAELEGTDLDAFLRKLPHST